VSVSTATRDSTITREPAPVRAAHPVTATSAGNLDAARREQPSRPRPT
jgi:hypothetical protein